jgi:hypothetical protein
MNRTMMNREKQQPTYATAVAPLLVPQPTQSNNMTSNVFSPTEVTTSTKAPPTKDTQPRDESTQVVDAKSPQHADTDLTQIPIKTNTSNTDDQQQHSQMEQDTDAPTEETMPTIFNRENDTLRIQKKARDTIHIEHLSVGSNDFTGEAMTTEETETNLLQQDVDGTCEEGRHSPK